MADTTPETATALPAEYLAAEEAYRERFGAGPPTFGLSMDQELRLAPALRRAVAEGRELTMADIREALGLRPLPAGAVI